MRRAGILVGALLAADQLGRMTGGRADWDGAEFGRDQAGGWFGEQPQRQLELASDYGSGGLYEEAIDVLRRLVEPTGDRGSVQDPLAYYHVAHYWARSGERTRGMGYAVAAAKLSPDSCFPFQLESVEILKEAMKLNPKDAVAPYLLGNLLYDLQSAEAIKAWERSAQLNPGFATVHRNLGLAYGKLKDHGKAVAALERAVECDPQDPKLYAELDAAYEAGNAEPAKRLAMLQKNHEVVKRRDDALLREISMLMVTGDYDRAVELIEGHHFHLWEGGSGLHEVYADAHLLRGRKLFAERKHVEAMVDFDAMLQYPENLETAKPARGELKAAAAHYWRGRVFEAMENRKKARECWQAAVKGGGGFSEASYWQGLAWTKLDELMMAKGTFEGLVRYGKERLAATEDVDFFAKFGTRRTVEWEKARAHYLIGLGLLGQGDGVAAKEEFEAVLRLNKSHLGATSMLQSMK